MTHVDWHCLCGDGPQSHVSYGDREECHGHCQKTERDCAGLGYRPIDQTRRTPAISAIFAAARQHFLPRAFTCDLSTDYQTLLDYDGRFVWVLRQSGTELYRLDDVTPEALDYSIAAYRYWTGEGRSRADAEEQRVYVWDGESLQEHSAEEALFILRDTRHTLDPLNAGRS